MSQNTIEALLSKKSEVIINEYNSSMTKLLEENGGDEKKVMEIVQKRQEAGDSMQKTTDYQTSVENLSTHCKFNATSELFEGYDSSGAISSECRDSIDNYVRTLKSWITY